MTIADALAVINTAAYNSTGPLREMYYAIKCAALYAAIIDKYPVRYLYDRVRPSIHPWLEDPQLLEFEYGPYYFDLLEVSINGSAFHVPISLASRYGLLEAIRDAELTYHRRNSVQTGSKLGRTPTSDEIVAALAKLIRWVNAIIRQKERVTCAALRTDS